MTVWDWELWIEVRHRIPLGEYKAEEFWGRQGKNFESAEDAGEWFVVDDLQPAHCLNRVDLLGALEGGLDFSSVFKEKSTSALSEFLEFRLYEDTVRVAKLSEIKAIEWDEEVKVLGMEDEDGKFWPQSYDRHIDEEKYMQALEQMDVGDKRKLTLEPGFENAEYTKRKIKRRELRSDQFSNFIRRMESLTNEEVKFSVREEDVRLVKGHYTS